MVIASEWALFVGIRTAVQLHAKDESPKIFWVSQTTFISSLV